MTQETDRILVRVWLKNGNGKKEAHISVQTANLYISVWPEEYLSKADLFELKPIIFFESNLESRKKSKPFSYEDDCALEGNKQPDQVFSFYSLDIKKLEERYQLLKNHASHLEIVRENLLTSKLSERNIEYGSGNSSKGFVWSLLNASGAYELDEKKQGFWKMDIVEDIDVNAFLKMLNRVKLSELKKHPESKTFDDHIGISTLNYTKKVSCQIM